MSPQPQNPVPGQPGPSPQAGAHAAPPAQHRSGHGSALESDDGRTIGQLLAEVGSNISTLMQQELALAKAEVRESAQRAGKGTGMLVGAGIGAFFVLLFLSISGWWALGLLVGNAWAALIVAGVWALIAAILGLVGKKEFERIRGIDRTTTTLGKVPNAVKGHEEDNR